MLAPEILPGTYPNAGKRGLILSLDLQNFGNRVLDTSGNANHGDLTGGGKKVMPFGMVLDFSGTQGFVLIENKLELFQKIKTVRFWFYLTDRNAYGGISQTLFNWHLDDNNKYRIAFDESDNGRCYASCIVSGIDLTKYGLFGISLMKWYCLEFSVMAGTSQLIINGELQPNGTSAWSAGVPDDDLRIGTKFSPDGDFSGGLGLVEFFNYQRGLVEAFEDYQEERWRYM